MSSKISLFLGLLAAGLHRVTAVDQVINAQLVDQTKLAATRLERLKLFPADNDTLFDFYSQPNFTWEPGSVVNMNTATFPYVTGNRMTLALLNLGPCSMLPPHYHPRAANFVVAVNGTTDTYMIEENGARTVTVTLTAGKATIFPMASIHMMENKGKRKPQKFVLFGTSLLCTSVGFLAHRSCIWRPSRLTVAPRPRNTKPNNFPFLIWLVTHLVAVSPCILCFDPRRRSP